MNEVKTNASYRQTVSKDYQSRSHEFGFEVVAQSNADGIAKVKRAQQLCEAIVRSALGIKIGRRRGDLDDLAREFFGVNWQELSSGVAQRDEVL